MFVYRFVIPVLAITQTIGSADPCQTPSGQDGLCRPLTECDSLLAVFKQKSLSSSDAMYLRSHHCGFVGRIPKVCCPNLLPLDICGRAIESKIVGGDKTDLDEFPWMALLQYKRKKNSTYFDCGGALISKRYVLTAAHCIKGNLVSVRLGEYDIKNETDCVTIIDTVCAPKPVTIRVEEAIPHEDYDGSDLNQYHDVAVLRLKKEVTFTDYIKPVCLPTNDQTFPNPDIGKSVHVAGWGITENGSTSDVKLKVRLPVKDHSDCESVFRSFNYNLNLTTSQLCVGGEKGKDSCRGDSGGPLMDASLDENKDRRWYAAGIVSFGATPCGMKNWPGVYTRVSDYVPWILSKMRS